MLLEDEENKREREHRNVCSIGEPIAHVYHHVTLSLVVCQRVNDGHVGYLDGGPANIENHRPYDVPCIEADRVAPDWRREKTKEGWDHDHRAHDVKSIALAPA